MVEFKQFPAASYMRRVVLNREHSGEQGTRATGYYGGIRKLHNQEDIEIWKNRLTAEAQVQLDSLVTTLHTQGSIFFLFCLGLEKKESFFFWFYNTLLECKKKMKGKKIKRKI